MGDVHGALITAVNVFVKRILRLSEGAKSLLETLKLDKSNILSDLRVRKEIGVPNMGEMACVILPRRFYMGGLQNQ